MTETNTLNAVILNLREASESPNPRFRLMTAHVTAYRNVVVENAREGSRTDNFWWNLLSCMESGLQASEEDACRDFVTFALRDAEARQRSVQAAA